jgi:hypothetical protein
MGTSGVVRIKDEFSGEFIGNIYKQCDGYVSGYGKEIKEILKGCSIINGITHTSGEKPKDIPEFFNGMGCMAAYLIGKLKGNRIGHFYIVPRVHGPGDYQYTYDLELSKEVDGLIQISIWHGEDLICKDLLDNVDMENLEKNLPEED